MAKILTEMLEKPVEVKTQEEDKIPKEKHEEKATEILVTAVPAPDIVHDQIEKKEIDATEEATEVLAKATSAAPVSEIIYDHVEKTEVSEATIHETEEALLTVVADIIHDHKEKTEADDSLKEEKLVQKTNDLDVKKIVEEHETNSIDIKTEELQELCKGK